MRNMKPKVYATKYLDKQDQVYDIEFYVVFEDEIGEKSNIGRYSVHNDDSIVGEVSDYIISNYFELVPQAKKIILENGLAEIVGSALNPKNYFYKNTISISKAVQGSFNRANQYIEKNKISCTNEYGYVEFDTDIYHEKNHKTR